MKSLLFILMGLASIQTMGAEKNDRFPDCYMPCVVALGYSDSAWHLVGTGFLMYNYDGDLPYLISNKHVFEKCDSLDQMLGHDKIMVKLNMTEAATKMMDSTSNGKHGWMRIPLHLRPGAKQAWVDHPNPDVDVAVMYFDIMPLLSGTVFGLSTASPLGKSICAPLDSLCVAQGVIFLGFPLGIGTESEPIPVVRAGIIAYIDEKAKTLLLDAQVFPGSSGSPVFSTGEFWGGPLSISGGRLIGVISGYKSSPTHLVKKKVRRTDNKQVDSLFVPLENAGLGVVYSSDLILETIEHFKAVNLQNMTDSTKHD